MVAGKLVIAGECPGPFLGRVQLRHAYSPGDLDVREDQLNDARERYEQALHNYSDAQDNLGLANALIALGDLDMSEDRVQDARGGYDQA